MRITRWGEFGILCSLFLAEKYHLNVSSGAAEIAQSQNIPLQYTQQILQRLRRGNIVQSIRGPLGGYKLSRAPELISLKDIFYAAEGDTFEIICETNPAHTNKCKEGMVCGLKNVWGDLKEAIDNILEKHTLASVLQMQEEEDRSLNNIVNL